MWLGMAVALALLGYAIWQGRERAIDEAQDKASNLAGVVEARWDATVRRLEAGLRQIVSRMPVEAMTAAAAPHYRSEMTESLRLLADRFPEISGYSIYDASGHLLYSSRGEDPLPSVGARAEFFDASRGPSSAITYSEVTSGGSGLTRAPWAICTKFCRMIDMPIAEISGASRGEWRSGR